MQHPCRLRRSPINSLSLQKRSPFISFHSTMYLNMFSFIPCRFPLISAFLSHRWIFPKTSHLPRLSSVPFACRVSLPSRRINTSNNKLNQLTNQQSLQRTIADHDVGPLSFSGFECRSLPRDRTSPSQRPRSDVVDVTGLGSAEHDCRLQEHIRGREKRTEWGWLRSLLNVNASQGWSLCRVHQGTDTVARHE